jgi:DNA polymerase (family 10)
VWIVAPRDTLVARATRADGGRQPSTRPVHHRSKSPLPLGRALTTIEAFLDALGPIAARLAPVGSVRRFEPAVGDLTLLAADDHPDALLDAIAALVPAEDLRDRSPSAIAVRFQREPINILIVPTAEAACALLHYTGSAAHVKQLQARAHSQGFQLTRQALTRTDTGAPVFCETEADIYDALDVPYIPPELRHGQYEFALAHDGWLDDLVTLDDVRGDLHVHTLWSDGRDSSEAVLRAIRKLGYEYVAITDHSERSKASRTLSVDRMRQQMVEIEALRTRFPDITILQGAEVEILADGRLDYPDDLLAELDIVLASLHEPDGQPPAQLLERYVGAMRHPLVNVITHPANRVPGQHEGYGLDYDTLFRIAAETQTAVEIDGAPGHLDLDGHLARRAIAAGATVTIDSDGHFAERLARQMRMGIGTARRGAVPTRQVLNTRPVEDVRQFVADKRARA